MCWLTQSWTWRSRLIITNLVRQKLVHRGTWVGVCDRPQGLIRRMVIEAVEHDGHLVGTLGETHRTVRVPSDWVVEIEGMTVTRFLEQAGLDCTAQPRTNVKKRGRKPKIRN
jgi:hypothetical protein